MPQVDPVILLFAADERAALVAELEACRALMPPAIAERAARRRPARGRDRLAIVTAPERVHGALDLAIDRLPSLTRPRFRARAEGLSFASGVDAGRIAFLFPGQGSEHIGMLRTLYERAPLVRGWFDDLDRAAEESGGAALSPIIYPPGESAHIRRARQPVSDMERGAQLGIVADLALHDLVCAIGIRADAYVGHSNGEHAAVIAAGRIAGSRAELCRRTVALGHESEALPPPATPEALIAVTLDRRRLVTLLERFAGALCLAMDNSPTQAVVGGQAGAADRFIREVAAAGGLALRLPFTRAYHTPGFADRAAMFAAHYRTLSIRPGQFPVYSCRSREPLPDDPDACRDEMTRQWTTVVDFRGTIERLYAEGVGAFVEIGPDSKLTAFVEDTLRGRPHVAVGANSPARDDVEQLAHLVGELFVAGVALDPARLLALMDDGRADVRRATPDVRPAISDVRPPTPDARLATPDARPALSDPRIATPDARSDVWRAAAEVHPRLIADARQRLARMAALVAASPHRGDSARPGPQAPRPQVITPLLDSSAAAQSGHLRMCRRFTRAGDPFVDDHALGRRLDRGPDLSAVASAKAEAPRSARDPATGRAAGYPLPVLAFTVSLEMAAEAAHRITGQPIREIHDARASRWLALDGGALTVNIEGRTGTDGGITITIGDRANVSAFEAIVPARSAPAAPLRLDRDPLARRPDRWSAATFYERYAFHGPSFQGLSQVPGVGPGSIEADLTITTIPGLPADALQLDPAMLDCAGQLVAFWLLEHERMEPTFGIFPFALGTLRLYRAPLAAGTRVHCRGRVARTGIGTSASFVFETGDGDPIASIEDFAQRLIQFPEWLGRRLFAGETSPIPPLVEVEQSGLFTAGSIWERALAHLTLSADELDTWAAMETDRTRWLVERIR